MSRCGSSFRGLACCLGEGHDMPHSSAAVGDGPWGYAWMQGDGKPVQPSREQLVAQLVQAVTDLVEDRLIFLVADGDSSSLVCSECRRCSLGGRPIEHAESCKTGKVTSLAFRLLTNGTDVEEMRSRRQQVIAEIRNAERPEPRIEYDVQETSEDALSGLDEPVRHVISMTHEEAALHAAGVR